jgi:hypothetical protein
MYVTKADGRSGGGGYERLIVATELVENMDTKKFIPVIRGNTSARKVPQFLGPRAYADFSRDEDYTNRLNELVAEIHNSPPTKPPVEASPFSGSIAPVEGFVPYRRSNRHQPLLAVSLNLGFKASMELRYALHDPINKPQVVLLNAVRKSERSTGLSLCLENRPSIGPRLSGMVSARRSRFRISHPPDGYLMIIWKRKKSPLFRSARSYEDMRDESAIFFITRIVRVTEALLFAANLYKALDIPDDTKVSVRVTHRGFSGRKLSSSNPLRLFMAAPRSVEDVSQTEIVEHVGRLRERLVENVQHLLEPLFMLFEFMEFESNVYQQIVLDFANGRST